MSFHRSFVDFFASLGRATAAASSRSLASSSSSSPCFDVDENGRHLFFALDEALAPDSKNIIKCNYDNLSKDLDKQFINKN